MSSAIELIVAGYIRLKDRQSLETMRLHRKRLVGDLKGLDSLDLCASIDAIDNDIAVIETGLNALSPAFEG